MTRPSPSRRLLLTVAAAALSAAVASPSLAASAEAEGILESKVLKVGEKAPAFVAETLKPEAPFNLSEHIGRKPVLMFFWSFFCGPCREEMPILQTAVDEIGADKVVFIGVNLDGKGMSKAVTKFVEGGGLKFTTVFDELTGVQYKIADPYGVAGTPTCFIIDLNGKIVMSTVGHTTGEEVKRVLTEALTKPGS